MTRLTGGWQVVIFVKSVARAIELDKLLVQCNFPSIAIHSGLAQEERCVPFSLRVPALRYPCGCKVSRHRTDGNGGAYRGQLLLDPPLSASVPVAASQM